MPKTSLHAFKAKDTRFVADWLKSKGLHKLFSVFEGIQEPFILSLACKSVVLNHVYIHSFRSVIKATEKFPWDGGIWSPGMDLWWGIWTAFRPRQGGIWTKILHKIQMPGGCPGGDVEASIWLVHYAQEHTPYLSTQPVCFLLLKFLGNIFPEKILAKLNRRRYYKSGHSQ